MNWNEDSGEYEAQVCVTPAGPCASGKSTNPIKALASLALGTMVLVGAVVVANDLSGGKLLKLIK